MRVFLDTNVLVSGFATRGLCADVIRLILAEHELVTSSPVLDAVRRALLRKLRLPSETVEDLLSFLSEYLVSPKQRSPLRISGFNETDRIILASALAARADMFVTGDKEILRARKRVAGIRIIDPRGFWDSMRTQPEP